MGMRSQIYVRFVDENGEKVLVARYFGSNYGTCMIARARYGIQWLLKMLAAGEHCNKSRMKIKLPNRVKIKLPRILETDFDMHDVEISSDIIKEWEEQFPEEEFNEFVFREQDNNDGKLFIDVHDDGEIKYCFLNKNADLENIMDSEAYMLWNQGDWRYTTSPYLPEEVKHTCEKNIKAISEMATLMTKEEVEDFLNADYSDLVGSPF